MAGKGHFVTATERADIILRRSKDHWSIEKIVESTGRSLRCVRTVLRDAGLGRVLTPGGGRKEVKRKQLTPAEREVIRTLYVHEKWSMHLLADGFQRSYGCIQKVLRDIERRPQGLNCARNTMPDLEESGKKQHRTNNHEHENEPGPGHFVHSIGTSLRTKLYTLDAKRNPVLEPDFHAWALWFDVPANREMATTMRRTRNGDVTVGTWFVGISSPHTEDPLFETYGRINNRLVTTIKAYTYRQAMTNHRKLLRELQHEENKE